MTSSSNIWSILEGKLSPDRLKQFDDLALALASGENGDTLDQLASLFNQAGLTIYGRVEIIILAQQRATQLSRHRL